MTKFWLIIGVVSFLLIGCGESGFDNEKQAETNEPEAVQAGNTDNNLIIRDSAGAQVEQRQVAPSALTAGLNPPHGQPGHDCAIAVGAPLDGSGAQNQPPSLPTLNQPVVQPNFQSGTTAKGLNPPHGQPGHDCAIAVGAPLDGSGGQAQPTALPTAQPTIQPNFNVGAPLSGNINPAHGQPGHDCAVAVGAALPVK